MATVTCQTPDCCNAGIEIPISGTFPAYCGPCGALLYTPPTTPEPAPEA